MVELLLEKGTPVNAKDGYGKTLLHWAARSANVNVLKLLLAKGAEVNTKDKKGRTPLHEAAVAQPFPAHNGDALTPLIVRGADVNAKDFEGNTPLRLAAKANFKEVVKLLKKQGAVE
jgi:ankyrin repeat protein